MTRKTAVRLTPEDLDNVNQLAATVQVDRGTPFVTRTDIIRTALKIAAESAAKSAPPVLQEAASPGAH